MSNQYVFAEDKTSKKGNGVNAVLKFMSETISFNDKLKSCIEAQDDPNVKQSLEQYGTMVEDLYKSLASVASDGIHSFSDKPEVQVEGEVERKKAPETPLMVNAPSVPKLP